MTFHCYTKDDEGKPVSNIIIRATVLQSGASFPRSSDGAGYSDVAILSNAHIGDDVMIEVIKEGFGVWTNYFKVTQADQKIDVDLLPFA